MRTAIIAAWLIVLPFIACNKEAPKEKRMVSNNFSAGDSVVVNVSASEIFEYWRDGIILRESESGRFLIRFKDRVEWFSKSKIERKPSGLLISGNKI